jgi:prevent-host-death family protein
MSSGGFAANRWEPAREPRPLTNLTNQIDRATFFAVMKSVSLYEAKTKLSRLVDEAADGEKIVIAKNGVPRAMLVPLPAPQKRRRPARALDVTYIAPDFDAPDEEIAALFGTRK